MKRSGLTPVLLAATLFLVVAGSLKLNAQEMSSTQVRSSKRAEELLKRYDKNGDGKIDDDERAEAKEAIMKEQLDRQMRRASAFPGGMEQFRAMALEMFDKNRDGQLDDEERAEAQKFAESHQDAGTGIDELTRRFDKNNNGRIDPEERASLDAYLAALRGLGAAKMREELLRRFDRNMDDKIDDNEMVELERFVRPRIESTPAQLRRYDQNNDGRLDEAEWAVARRTILQWLNQNGPPPMESESTKNDEAARLQRASEEVARRRSAREQAMQALPPPPERKVSNADEEMRLKAAADEVARRRELRTSGAQPEATK